MYVWLVDMWLSYEYEGINKLSSKNKINDKLGIINVIYNGETLDTIDVYLDKTLHFNLLLFLIQTKMIYPTILIIIAIISIVLIHNKNILYNLYLIACNITLGL